MSQLGAGPQPTNDIDTLKTTTHNLTKELVEMKKMLQDMQTSAQEKDSEIIKLNMNLAGEKKKTQDFLRASRGKLIQSQSSKSHSLDTRTRFENKLIASNYSPDIEYNFENTTGILGMGDEGFVSSQKYHQLQEEIEQLITDNKQLKKKVDAYKKA